jgi:hypothetical protein
VDATYEGDLMAQADVRYIVGRESRDAYQESLAGIQDVHQLDKLLDSPAVVKQFHPWLGESSLMKPTIACSIRMEPVYMMMGQASGAAGALTAKSGRPVQSLPYDELQAALAQQGQIVLKLPPAKP